jgi:hypothetical protein
MATNAQVIAALEADKTTLQNQVAAADANTTNVLMDAIQAISNEVGAIQQQNLSTANYIPATTLFNNATQEGKGFVASLTQLKNTFATLNAVASAIDQVIKIATGLGL